MDSNFHYEIILYWSKEDQAYIAEVPELPGCAADGATYQEALANPLVTIHLGRRKVTARAEPEKNPAVIRAVNAAYRKKYGERWPDDTQAMLKRSLLPTTLRLTPI